MNEYELIIKQPDLTELPDIKLKKLATACQLVFNTLFATTKLKKVGIYEREKVADLYYRILDELEKRGIRKPEGIVDIDQKSPYIVAVKNILFAFETDGISKIFSPIKLEPAIIHKSIDGVQSTLYYSDIILVIKDDKPATYYVYDKQENDVTVCKVSQDDEKRLVYGVVLVPDQVDLQGDVIKADVIEKAAHEWMQTSRMVGFMHSDFTRPLSVVESYIAPTDIELNGSTIKKGSWVMSVFVEDQAIWDGVKNGQLTGFSIGGTGIRQLLKGVKMDTINKNEHADNTEEELQDKPTFELVNLAVHEVSIVDSPAIGIKFIALKNETASIIEKLDTAINLAVSEQTENSQIFALALKDAKSYIENLLAKLVSTEDTISEAEEPTPTNSSSEEMDYTMNSLIEELISSL